MNVLSFPSVPDAELFLKETELQLKNAQPYSPEKQHLMWVLSQVATKGKVGHSIKRKATSLIYVYSDDRAAINEFVHTHKCETTGCCDEYQKSAAYIRNYWFQQDNIEGVI